MKAISQTDIETGKKPAPLLRPCDEEVRTHAPQIEQAAGNQALQRKLSPASLQTKLHVGSATDPLEREADLTADWALGMSESQLRRKLAAALGGSVQTQLTSSASGLTGATETIRTRIDASRGGGRPLGEAERSFFELRFGSDFSGVRLHSDSRAADLASLVRARALTVGQDIYFGKGESPGLNADSGRLLAHELTHVVQQGFAGPENQSGPSGLIQREEPPASSAAEPPTIDPTTRSS